MFVVVVGGVVVVCCCLLFVCLFVLLFVRCLFVCLFVLLCVVVFGVVNYCTLFLLRSLRPCSRSSTRPQRSTRPRPPCGACIECCLSVGLVLF